MIAALLILGAITLVLTNIKEVREIYIFAGVLVVQSLPFIAATGLAVVERSRFNDFARWRALDARLTVLMPWRTPAMVEIAKVTAPVPEREVVK